MMKKSIVYIGLAVAYCLLPDLMPGVPVDDIIVTIICALVNKKFGEEKIRD